MSSNPQFLFDFGSPNAFLSHEAIPAIEKRTNVKFEYVPILLGGIFKATNNKSPAETLAGIKNKREFNALETERFLKRFGVKPYVWNPFFPVNTLNLMRAAAAQFEGVFEKYVEAAFHHMWVEPKKWMTPKSRPRRWPRPASMPQLLARSQDADVKARLIENTQTPSSAARSARRHSSSARKCFSARSSFAKSRKWSRGNSGPGSTVGEKW